MSKNGTCFAALSNDAGLIGTAMGPFRSLLQYDEGAPFGWGLGYYHAGEALLLKQPRAPEGPFDFTERIQSLRSGLLMGFRHGEPTGSQSMEDTQPFRFRTWLGGHIGRIDRFEEIKPQLLEAIPDFIRRNIRGTTESEHLFHLYLAFLNDTGEMDDARVTGRVAARALASCMTYLNRLCQSAIGNKNEFCFVVTNGSVLLATHAGFPLNIARQNSYHRVGRDLNNRAVSYPHLKTVMLVGGTAPDTPGWESVAEDSIVMVDPALNIEYSPQP